MIVYTHSIAKSSCPILSHDTLLVSFLTCLLWRKSRRRCLSVPAGRLVCRIPGWRRASSRWPRPSPGWCARDAAPSYKRHYIPSHSHVCSKYDSLMRLCIVLLTLRFINILFLRNIPQMIHHSLEWFLDPSILRFLNRLFLPWISGFIDSLIQ